MALFLRTNEEHAMPGNPREMITMAERKLRCPHQDRGSAGRSRLAPY
jgi:hypothetical protein